MNDITAVTADLMSWRSRSALQSPPAGNLRATAAAPRPGLLLRGGPPSPGLLSGHGAGTGLRQPGGDVAGARHAALGPRGAGQVVREEFLPVQPLQLGADAHRHRAREQVGQRQR